MTIKFDRPIGTPADLKELEYLSALHQTCMPELRQDASIDATDIVNILLSRHGLSVDTELVNKGILIELAGELHDEDVLYKMDLCQVVAILLIPHLLEKRGQELEKVLAVLVDPLEHNSSSITRELLRETLDLHGETNVQDNVLDEMIAAAGGEGTKLDESSLLRALTSDITLYKPEWANRRSTHFQDVWWSFSSDDESSGASQDTRARDEEAPRVHNNSNDGDVIGSPAIKEETIESKLKYCFSKNKDEQYPPVRKIFTARAVDNTADTYRNQSYAVLLWVSMILVYLAYFYNFNYDWGRVNCSNLSDFSCKLVNGITSWLVIFVELSFFGTSYICFGSAGNSLYDNSFISISRLLVGMVLVIFATILSLAYVVITPVFSTEKQDDFLAAYVGAAIVGSILVILQLLTLTGECCPAERLKKYKFWKSILTPGIEKMERNTKRAALKKMSLMVDNALVYHAPAPDGVTASMSRGLEVTAGGIASLNYEMRKEKTERVGGLWWAWKRVLNGSIFYEEGIWLHSRLVSSTVSQFFICIFVVVFFAILVKQILESANNDQANSDESSLAPTPAPTSSADPFVYPWEAIVAGAAGILCGLSACFLIAISYIPSFISSCLKYRSGYFPSLRYRGFQTYRCAVDLVTQLYGAAFWGCIFTGIIATVLIGGIVFLGVWHKTRSVVLTIIAQLLGCLLTLGVKQIIMLFLRRQFLAGFYRRMPFSDNIMNVVLECWNIGLTSGIMLIRTAKLLLVTACFLGRLDTPLLAEGVGFIGPIALDSYPISFRKDLLQHDAHRHPYIERLATMYMMKIRYGDDFGTRAGGCWRLLFVLCFMPWMRKYRLRVSSHFVGLGLDTEEDENELNGEDEDGAPERQLQRARTKRTLQSMKNLKALQDMDTRRTVSREELLEKENTLLRERIRQLSKENRQLRRIPMQEQERELYFFDAHEVESETS